ncbi:hypothetical protein BCR35DRAFT_299655 [Leucosporidium creatinivorum]|uniref:Small nuclear ribonucleoprotein Prp3 C-terminal domain-containing protein n=1 Tax=Leucosporidium creatinivorum TaxID=106004 RepID=A0A1Y2G0E3_9BASI|nr:hypothetical protein BCR35DRAFT_299655 [Leucosporidium creatinivorum]
MASTATRDDELQHRSKVLEELNLLRSGLLEDEFEWSLLTAHDEQLWETALLDPSPSPAQLLKLPLPDFSLSLSSSSQPSIHLSAQYHSFVPSPLPILAIHASSISRSDQAALNEELQRVREGAEEEGEEYPLFSIVTAMREYLISNPPQPPAPPPKPSSWTSATSTPNPGKRKNIVSWASELQLWGISKPGYPGVIVVEGLQGGVDEFVWRIKQLNWKALQVRCEVDGFSSSSSSSSLPPEVQGLGQRERIEWALREKSCLGRVLGGAEGEGGKIGVSSSSALAMTKAGLEEVFRTAMKL